MDILNQILLRSLVIFLMLGSVLGLLVGLGLLLRPAAVAAFNDKASRWVSTEHIEEQLDRPRWVERVTYRHHRIVGAIVFVGACFVLYTFLLSHNVRKLAAMMPPASWRLVDALIALLVVGSVVAAIVGLAILAKPSMLREFEKTTNKWVSTDGALRYFNAMRHGPEQNLLRRPRAVGAFFVLGSLFTLVMLGRLMWGPGINF